MGNDAEVSIKFKNQVTGETKLEKYAENLKVISSLLNGIDKGALQNIDASAKASLEMSKSVEKTKTTFNKALNFTKFGVIAAAIKKLGAVISSTTKKSADFLENFNLFQVAFNGNYKSAERFINKMSEMYGLDESWLTRTVGNFKQLTNAMNLTADMGEKVSTLLTQMSLDISSLYNVDIDRAAETLRSAMAGQTKPIRGVTGGDITQATLQTTLDQLGIDATVNKLSYAEKRLLIIISLTKQLNASIGDMGRTIESPANQLRIMNEQWERLTRAVGNAFLPLLAKILPYLNAILMVLTEIINSIAALLGYSQDDFDYFDSASAGAWDLDEGLQSAGASAKKLKQGLRGFDKLNVISSSRAGGSGSGGGIGGINPKILEAFNASFEEYQNKLKDVEMKATRIRDRIMEWLGYTKQVNEETGKISFKYTGRGGILAGLEGTLAAMTIPRVTALKNLVKDIKSLSEPAYGNNNILQVLHSDNYKRLKPIQEAFNNLKSTISSISYDNLAITSKEKKKIIDSINGLTKSLKTALNNYVNEQIKKLNYLYKETGVITKEEYDERLKELEKFQKDEEAEINKQGEKLKKTYETIYDANGNIIIKNYAAYLDELDKYELKSYQALVIGEEDKKKIMAVKLNETKENQIKYFSELLQGYAKDRDNAIKKAEEKRDGTIKAAEELYGKESATYRKIKKEAEETFESEKKSAEQNYDAIYNSFKKNQGDIANYIDKDNGKVLTKWEKFCKKINDIWDKWTTKKIKVEGQFTSSSGTSHTGGGVKHGATGGVFTPNGQKLDVRRFAAGGLPPVGQMFIAREKGAELVGQIGNHTAVMNNDQIVASVASGVYDAVYKANLNSKSTQTVNPTIIVQVGDKEIAKQVITDLQDMAKTNGKPITIGG